MSDCSHRVDRAPHLPDSRRKGPLDADLAILYEVETKTLNRAVHRNLDRFPDDFMFRLTKEELENLRCQFGTSRWGGRRYQPYAFTEHGVAMLSSVLNSKRAVQVNLHHPLVDRFSPAHHQSIESGGMRVVRR